MSATEFTRTLIREQVSFELIAHRRTETAYAEALEIGLTEVGKTIVLSAHGRLIRALVPASARLDLRKLRQLLGEELRLASEAELLTAYPMFELGAVPPFGGPAGDRTILDRRLALRESVVFEAGSHEKSVRLRTRDIVRLAQALIADICEADPEGAQRGTETTLDDRETMLEQTLDPAAAAASRPGSSELETTLEADRAAVPSFAIAGEADERLAPFLGELEAALTGLGFTKCTSAEEADFVLNVIDPQRPRPFRRRSRGTFVAALALLPEEPADALRETYPLLVRALANIALCYIPGLGVSFTTMERGHYVVPAADAPALAAAVAERLAPLARARLVIDNVFAPDLEPELWAGDDATVQIAAAGQRLDRLGLLPAPFPIEDLVNERDLRHIKRLYGIGGLSYGNLSVRKDATRFWMSASGVDKGALVEPGRDILLVTGFDSVGQRMLLSVPPECSPRRVSVDAIEHWVIYREHPGVGAILHVHAWIDGVVATEINFPCGTAELAASVAALIAREPDPNHAVIGLRNHGITATGESLDEILDRIEPVLLRQVPMS